jgi:hypothetical protein
MARRAQASGPGPRSVARSLPALQHLQPQRTLTMVIGSSDSDAEPAGDQNAPAGDDSDDVVVVEPVLDAAAYGVLQVLLPLR